jgi:hypothetical protein
MLLLGDSCCLSILLKLLRYSVRRKGTDDVIIATTLIVGGQGMLVEGKQFLSSGITILIFSNSAYYIQKVNLNF